MPIKNSAKKYMRASESRTITNKIVKGAVKSVIKKTREAAKTGDAKMSKELMQKAQKALDKAVQKNIIKKNTAARKKSRLNALIKKAASK
jgi:small subunit ribosomal protein S20